MQLIRANETSSGYSHPQLTDTIQVSKSSWSKFNRHRWLVLNRRLSSSAPTSMISMLERLLFAQGGHCFFCREPLPREHASVEHLVASSNGGTNDESNCVVCCKTLNQLLGAKSIKEKMHIVLNQRGSFVCPKTAWTPKKEPQACHPSGENTIAPIALNDDQKCINLVLENLRKRGKMRPGKQATLANTIRALMAQHRLEHTEEAVAALIKNLQMRGIVRILDGKVSYEL